MTISTALPATSLPSLTPSGLGGAPGSGLAISTPIPSPPAGVGRPFAAMTVSYCLGAFNDNFYKQACMLLAVGVGLTSLQGYIAMAFIAPYLIASAPAGWLADRFPKRTVVILTKALELLAMTFGAAGILLFSWPLILTMCLLMGLQSCLFSPALNGAVPELFPEAQVARANSVLKAAVIGAVLCGIALGGVVLERGETLLGGAAGIAHPAFGGRLAVALTVLSVAALGLLLSFGTPRQPAARPDAPFPVRGPLDTIQELRRLRRDPELFLAALLGTVVWTVGALEIMLLNPLGKNQLGIGETATSALLAAQMLGVAVGGGLSTLLMQQRAWTRWAVPLLIALSGLLASVSAVPYLPEGFRYPGLLALTAASGVVGGLLLVPCEAFVQIRPAADRRGAVLGAYGFLFAVGVILAGMLANLLNAVILPTQGFAVIGLLSLLLAGYSGLQLKGRAL